MESPRYPPGTELRFGSEYEYDDYYEIDVDKIPGMSNLNAEDKVAISAVGYVSKVSTRQRLGRDGKVKSGKCVSIQITGIKVSKKGDLKNMNMKEYKSERKKMGAKVY